MDEQPLSSVKCKRRSARKTNNVERSPLKSSMPLVPNDGLRFHYIDARIRSYMNKAISPGLEAEGAKLCRLFHEAFNDVWRQPPRSDRERILGYWLKPCGIVRAMLPCVRSFPCIGIRADNCITGDWSLSRYFGTVLEFRTYWVAGDPARLRNVIAFALATSFLNADPDCRFLHLKMIDEPLDEWREVQSELREEDLVAKEGELWVAYCDVYDGKMDHLLSRWGFTMPPRYDLGEPWSERGLSRRSSLVPLS